MVDIPLSPLLYSPLGPTNTDWETVSPIILSVFIRCQPGTLPDELPPEVW